MKSGFYVELNLEVTLNSVGLSAPFGLHTTQYIHSTTVHFISSRASPSSSSDFTLRYKSFTVEIR